MNSDKKRKDIFSWLENILPTNDDFSLQDVQKAIIMMLPTIVKSPNNEKIKRIVGAIRKFRGIDYNNYCFDKLGVTISGRVKEDTKEPENYEIRIDGNEIILKIGNSDPISIAGEQIKKEEVDLKKELSDDDFEIIKGAVKKVYDGIRESEKELIAKAFKVILEDANDRSWYDLIYAPFFARAFECICYSVLSGEYAMDDNFSKRVRDLSKSLRKATLHEGEDSWLNYLSPFVVTLSQILDEYNLFCIQIDTQVDKEPSAVLRKSEEYYDRHKYVDRFYKFMSSAGGGFHHVNPMLLHFFQAFLEMARIDQNFYFSTNNFSSLMYLRELLYDGDNGKGLVRIWEKCGKESLVYDFQSVRDVLDLARLKNNILLRKMWEGCYEELKDLTYVGQDKVLIFDPRKCREKEVGEEYHTELLLSDKLFDDSKKDRVKDLLNKTKALVTDTCLEETDDKTFEGYEKEYIKAKWGDEDKAIKATGDYYRSIMMSQTSHTSLDIRHYNSKVIEMSKDAVFYTADFRIWIKHHKYDYEEAVAFSQIHKVLLFLQNHYSEGEVCYDSEMLEGYARWCIEFLNTISKKAPEPDSSRPSQIEETLLLLETINSLLDRLVVSIEKGNYCLPFASKFRGCFFKYNEQDNDKPVLERVFVEGVGDDGYKKEDFEPFISAGTSEEKWMGLGDEDQIEKRKDILFIASSFVPPFNLERLKALKTKFNRETHKLRNEIHADYFNRLREYVKEDSMKQLEENRRSVVQILGIFAAFLALTTVALGASTANQSDLPFMTIMIGFTFCIAVFIGLLFFITHTNIRRNIERQNIKDNVSKNRIYEDISSVVKSNINDIEIIEKKIEKDFSDIKNMIKDECEKLNGKFQTNSVEITKLKETAETQILEAEQKQRSKIQEINNRITNEIDKKIEEYGKRQKCMNNWRLWGPSIFISIMLIVIAVLILVKSRPVEKPELKEVKIDITSNNTVDGKKEDDAQNKAPYDLIFPHAYNYSTAPLVGMPQSLQSAGE